MLVKKIKGDDQYWYNEFGLLHREDGPAHISYCGKKTWYNKGIIHRVDGPAVEFFDGTKFWYLNDKYHREDGPAREWPAGISFRNYKEWYLNGELYSTEDEWKKALVKFKIKTARSNFVTEKETNIDFGYHKDKITKGEFGKISKIQEELEELIDANKQGIVIMEHAELSDLYGAIEAYSESLGLSMDDLAKMSQATRRAFQSGQRQ